MMYTLDLSGHDSHGKAGICRFGGLYTSPEKATAAGHSHRAASRLPFRPDVLWVKDEAGEITLCIDLKDEQMSYELTITATDGGQRKFQCGGASDQAALIYAGKVVEAHADAADPGARIALTRNGTSIGPSSTVRDMLNLI